MEYTAPDAYTASIVSQGRIERLEFTAAVAELHAASLRTMAAAERFKSTDFYPEALADDIMSLLRTASTDIHEAAGRASTRLDH